MSNTKDNNAENESERLANLANEQFKNSLQDVKTSRVPEDAIGPELSSDIKDEQIITTNESPEKVRNNTTDETEKSELDIPPIPIVQSNVSPTVKGNIHSTISALESNFQQSATAIVSHIENLPNDVRIEAAKRFSSISQNLAELKKWALNL